MRLVSLLNVGLLHGVMRNGTFTILVQVLVPRIKIRPPNAVTFMLGKYILKFIVVGRHCEQRGAI